MRGRIKYLRQQAQVHNLPLEDDWDEARIREEFRKYGIPQSGIKPDGTKSNPPTRKVQTVQPAQASFVFDNSIDFGVKAPIGRIENNIPFVTREQRDRMLAAQKPKVDPVLASIQVGQSFQVEQSWNKSVAMQWAARAKKHRQAKNLSQSQFDLRTGPCPKNSKRSRVWRIV